MPQASRATRRLSAELVPTSMSRESEAAMPQASRKGSFAVGEAGAKLARAFESEAAIRN